MGFSSVFKGLNELNYLEKLWKIFTLDSASEKAKQAEALNEYK